MYRKRGHFESYDVSSHNSEHPDAIRHLLPNHEKKGAGGVNVRMIRNIMVSCTKPMAKMK